MQQHVELNFHNLVVSSVSVTSIRKFNQVFYHCIISSLQDPKHKGRGNTDGSPHFHCGDNNAVYVAMDQIVKITQSDNNSPPIPGDNPPVTAQPRSGPAGGTRSSKSNQSDGEEKGLLDRVKEAKDKVTRALNPCQAVNIVASATVHSKFAIGDNVVLQPVDSAPIRGIVRWAGPIKTSKDTGGIVIPVVGLETVSNGY